MSKLTIAVLNGLVIEEATKLKKNSTINERERLTFDRLNPSTIGGCIYGQMTGSCFSSRATVLIKKNCKRVLERKPSKNFNGGGMFDEVLVGELNGSPKTTDRNVYWSPIEVFITQPRNRKNGNNKKLIDFINGESETLELK